jgi:hypothetical protein
MPPTIALAMFATPWPISSTLDRCRAPIIPSETTAESNDSIPPSIAMVNAGPTSPRTCAQLRSGSVGTGIDALITPKRLPIVSTSSPPSCTTSVVTMSATNGLGTFVVTRGQRSTIASPSSATSAATGSAVPIASPYAPHFSTNSAGTVPIVRPRKSLTCDEKMMSAIPLVKPMITGCGMNLMAAPNLRSPMATRITPAMSVATMSPSTPYCWTIP